MSGSTGVSVTYKPEVSGTAADLTAQSLSSELSYKGAFSSLDKIPANLRLNGEVRCRYLINGELKDWDGPVQTVKSPIGITNSRGELESPVVGTYPLLGAEEAMSALSSARRAYDEGLGTWPQMTPEQRISCVEKFLEKMVGKRGEVVKLLMWEICKTLPDAEKEFDRTVEYVQKSVTALRSMTSSESQPQVLEGVKASLVRNPLGTVLCMGPFNYPLNETFTTLMPALLMGNTVLFKPPKLGVVLFEPLMEAFRDCFPPGVVNYLPGDGRTLVTPMMKSGEVDVLAFIGSSKVADAIIDVHPHPHYMHQITGLGAKNVAVVLPDADIESTAREFVKGALSYNGQRCTALKIAMVHESIAENFAQKVAEEVGKLKCGMPWEAGVKITPLAEDGKVEWMNSYIEDARANGARVLNPGGGSSEGALFTPAVLFPASKEMKISREEQFGPIVPIATYRDANEVLRYIADSPFRQQASIFGTDRSVMNNLASPLSRLVCRVNLNSQCQRGPDEFPFVGRKGSGMGILSVEEALLRFSAPCLMAERA